jgi:lysophospholipase L1-like esterase
VVTVEGYFAGVAGAGSEFRPVACRLFNTRTMGSGLQLAANATIDIQVAGVNGVPLTGVAGAMLNLTVTPDEAGYLKAWPATGAEPAVTIMDFDAGNWRTNGVVIKPGSNGKIRIRNGSAGAIHLIVDIQGWFDKPGNGQSMKIMPLGDSITYGDKSTNDEGYHSPLYLRLVNEAGYAPDFVGSQTTGVIVEADHNHEGHKGYQIDQIQAGIDGWMATYQPDVVLLHIGTNDMYRNYQVATAPDRLGALIDQILAKKPTTQVLVSKLIPSADAATQTRIDAYNAAIPGIVASKGPRVHLVDMAGITTADLFDLLHPTDLGYAKMSDRWYPVLTSVLGG